MASYNQKLALAALVKFGCRIVNVIGSVIPYHADAHPVPARSDWNPLRPITLNPVGEKPELFMNGTAQLSGVGSLIVDQNRELSAPKTVLNPYPENCVLLRKRRVQSDQHDDDAAQGTCHTELFGRSGGTRAQPIPVLSELLSNEFEVKAVHDGAVLILKQHPWIEKITKVKDPHSTGRSQKR